VLAATPLAFGSLPPLPLSMPPLGSPAAMASYANMPFNPYGSPMFSPGFPYGSSPAQQAALYAGPYSTSFGAPGGMAAYSAMSGSMMAMSPSGSASASGTPTGSSSGGGGGGGNINDERRPWTKEEDVKVNDLVKKYGTKKWSLVGAQLEGRTGKQCRERWHNHRTNRQQCTIAAPLFPRADPFPAAIRSDARVAFVVCCCVCAVNPIIKKDTWLPQEDLKIIEMHRTIGSRWSEIAKHLPGRTGQPRTLSLARCSGANVCAMCSRKTLGSFYACLAVFLCLLHRQRGE